jgi:hypothetical protein
VSRVVPLAAGQLPLFEMPVKRRSRKARYRHVHTKEELAAFDRTLAVLARIRGGLEEDERLVSWRLREDHSARAAFVRSAVV